MDEIKWTFFFLRCKCLTTMILNTKQVWDSHHVFYDWDSLTLDKQGKMIAPRFYGNWGWNTRLYHLTKSGGKDKEMNTSLVQVACATINILYLGHFKFFSLFLFLSCLSFPTVSSRRYYTQDDARWSNALSVCSHHVCITVVYDGLFRKYFHAEKEQEDWD